MGKLDGMIRGPMMGMPGMKPQMPMMGQQPMQQNPVMNTGASPNLIQELIAKMGVGDSQMKTMSIGGDRNRFMNQGGRLY